MKKLSIIIPFYNTHEYCKQLLDNLDKQITNEVQVIVVDDGSTVPFKTNYTWVELYRQDNAGVSAARNTGLSHVKGEYITYIDSDDLVADNYISTIINKIDTEHFDYCYMSWKTLPGGWNYEVKLKTINDNFPPFNLCCWNRIYKTEFVKDIKFNTTKLIAEDAEYIREAEERCSKKSFISDFMYYYRSDTPNSLTKRFAKGELNTSRIVYNFKYITKDMSYLIDEVKTANETSEVIIMTTKNDIPELKKYAMITNPMTIKGTELRGEYTNLFSKITIPIKTQIVIYTAVTFNIGGIETFIYNFCKSMCDNYNILVVYNSIDKTQLYRLNKIVSTMKNNSNQVIECDYIIVNRITDTIPSNIKYKHKIQMVHGCKIVPTYHVPDGDYTIPVSNTVKESFPELQNRDCNIIHNFTYVNKPRKVLHLLSATRLTYEKGEDRMIKLANLLNKNNIPFVWNLFAERPLKEMPNGMVFLNPTLDVTDFMVDADYVVQLSDSEAFGYTIVEALCLGIPVLTTPIPVMEELGFKDGETGFYVPFNITDSYDVQKIYDANLKFDYKYDNDAIKKQWKEILGDTKKQYNNYIPQKNMFDVVASKEYRDLQLNRIVKFNETISVDYDRAKQLIDNNVARPIQR